MKNVVYAFLVVILIVIAFGFGMKLIFYPQSKISGAGPMYPRAPAADRVSPVPFNDQVATNLCAAFGGVKKIEGTSRSTRDRDGWSGDSKWVIYRVEATCMDESTVTRMEWRLD